VLAQALVSFSVSAQDVALSIYLSNMGYSAAEVGLVLSVAMITTIALLIPGGILADTFGRRRVASLGLMLGGLSILGYIYPFNLYYLLTIAVLGGVGSALYGGSVTAVLADIAPTPEKRNTLFSVAASIYALAGVIGSLGGGIPTYLRSLGYPLNLQYLPALAFMGASLFASSLLFLSIRVGHASSPRGGRPSLVMPRKSVHIIARGMVYGILFSMAVGLISRSIFSLWLKVKFGLSEGFISYIYASAQAALMIAFLISPAIARRLGSVGTVVALQALGFSLLLPLALTESTAVAGIIYASMIVLLSMPNPVLRSFIIGLVDPSERASSSTVIALSMNLSSSFTPAVTGYLMSNISLAAPIYISGLIGSSSVVLFYALFSKFEGASR